MNNKEIMDLAIDELIGKVKIGDIVACRSHKLTHTLVDIVGNIGICSLPDGTVNHFPISELFDVNRMMNRALQLKFEESLLIDNRN